MKKAEKCRLYEDSVFNDYIPNLEKRLSRRRSHKCDAHCDIPEKCPRQLSPELYIGSKPPHEQISGKSRQISVYLLKNRKSHEHCVHKDILKEDGSSHTKENQEVMDVPSSGISNNDVLTGESTSKTTILTSKCTSKPRSKSRQRGGSSCELQP